MIAKKHFTFVVGKYPKYKDFMNKGNVWNCNIISFIFHLWWNEWYQQKRQCDDNAMVKMGKKELPY